MSPASCAGLPTIRSRAAGRRPRRAAATEPRRAGRAGACARARDGRRGRWPCSPCADRGAAPDLPALSLEVSTAPTDDPSMALSLDGTQLAFVANRDRVPVALGPRARRRREPRAAWHRRRELSVLVAGRPHPRVLRERQAEANRRRRWRAAGRRRRAERARRHVERRRRHPVRARRQPLRSCACRRAAVPWKP